MVESHVSWRQTEKTWDPPGLGDSNAVILLKKGKALRFLLCLLICQMFGIIKLIVGREENVSENEVFK